jgi:hypothetical protein
MLPREEVSEEGPREVVALALGQEGLAPACETITPFQVFESFDRIQSFVLLLSAFQKS